MDNLTHSLVGLAAAKAGLGRTSHLATFVCVAAANLPDADVVVSFKSPAAYLEHHRGITHSIVGIVALGLLFPAVVYACERLYARARGREPRARFKGLLLCSLVLIGSHPLLDWTNSYGVRPFLPWDGRWIYGDLLFIIDPWVWMILGGACFLLTSRTRWGLLAWAVLAAALTTLFVVLPFRFRSAMPPMVQIIWLAGLAVIILLRWRRAGERRGALVAGTALALVAVYCGALAFVQARAYREAALLSDGLARQGGESLMRVAATPTLANPFTWRCLAETDRSTMRFDLPLGDIYFENLRGQVFVDKPSAEESAVVERASREEAARVLLNFSRFPVARVVRDERGGGWVVQFADLRFTEPSERAASFAALNVPVPPAP